MADFIKVALATDVPDNSAIAVEIDGRAIAIFNIGGRLHAIENDCTHIGGPLCEGRIEGDQVFCPWHGAPFDIKSGAALGPPAMAGVKAFETKVEGDDVLIAV